MHTQRKPYDAIIDSTNNELIFITIDISVVDLIYTFILSFYSETKARVGNFFIHTCIYIYNLKQCCKLAGLNIWRDSHVNSINSINLNKCCMGIGLLLT